MCVINGKGECDPEGVNEDHDGEEGEVTDS
jgi:hypothetical protein